MTVIYIYIYIYIDPHIYMVLEKTLENQEKGMTEDKLVRWHHWLNGLEFVQALGDGEGWETWCAAVHGTAKSQTRLSDWTSANIYVAVVVAKLCLTLLQPHGLWPAWLPCSWGFSGKDTGVGCHFLLQGIFPTQGSSPRFPAWTGRFFTTEPPGKHYFLDSLLISLKCIKITT